MGAGIGKRQREVFDDAASAVSDVCRADIYVAGTTNTREFGKGTWINIKLSYVDTHEMDLSHNLTVLPFGSSVQSRVAEFQAYFDQILPEAVRRVVGSTKRGR